MKKYFFTLLLVFGFFRISFSQTLLNSPIRKSLLEISMKKTENIRNEIFTEAEKKNKKLNSLGATVSENSITIVNPNNTTILFALGSQDVIDVQKLEPNQIWTSKSVDRWQNLVVRTLDRQFVYSLKTGNCFVFVWNSTLKFWDVKTIKCKVEK